MLNKYVLFLILILILWAFPAHAARAIVSWDEVTENADGTPCTDLAGYRVYWGTTSGVYTNMIDVGNVLTYTVTNLSIGQTYYFVCTAYDTSGNESNFSNETSKRVNFLMPPLTIKIN